MSYSEKELTRAMDRAKIGLMSEPNCTFITTVLFSLQASWDDLIPTACTNGFFLKINPDWFMGLTERARIGLLAHEAWHVAFQHMLRLHDRDPRVFNEACDHVINLMLLDVGMELPPNGLHDKQFKGMSSEEVYDILIQNPQQQQPNFSMDIEGPGDGDAAEGDKPTKEEMENQIVNTLVKARTQSQMSSDKAGSIPGEIEVALDKLLNPKLPWNVLLQNYLHSMDKEDYSFRRPNRRYMPDYHLPSLYSESLDCIAAAFDISGSVTDNEFTAYRTELNHVKQSMNPKRLDVLAFDTRIQDVYELGQDEDVSKVTFHGRGGTDLRPVFAHYEKKPPTVLIIFSDLHCAKIEKDPGYPVIWICVNNPRGEVNFGKLIHYETPK